VEVRRGDKEAGEAENEQGLMHACAILNFEYCTRDYVPTLS
jgi:hypothetical protein